MNYLNSCLLLGRYHSINVINDDTATLSIAINTTNGNITIPVIIGTEVAYQMLEKCEDNCMISIKEMIDVDKHGLIIRAEKITFLVRKERAD